VIYGEVLECYDDPWLKHYRFCRCYSAACPRGELGDVHVSVIERFISREEFERRLEAWAGRGQPRLSRLPSCSVPGPSSAASPALRRPIDTPITSAVAARSITLLSAGRDGTGKQVKGLAIPGARR